MANVATWFEIPVLDFERAEKFYSRILGVEIERNFIMDWMTGIFKNGNDGVSGAIVCGSGYLPTHAGTLVYLNGGDDLTQSLSRVEAAGGKVLVPKTLISEDAGCFAVFEDTEGNRVAFHSKQ